MDADAAPSRPARAPRVALWGTFDADNLGDALHPLLTRAELDRRMPDGVVDTASPYGFERALRLEGDAPSRPLGDWSPAQAVAMAADADLVVVGLGEVLHVDDAAWARFYGVGNDDIARRSPSRFFIEATAADGEEARPVAWHAVGVPFDLTADDAARLGPALAGRAYVSVRDELSRKRLADAGIDRDVVVVPDPCFVAPRHLAAHALDKRAALARMLGWLPEGEAALVVQGDRGLVPHAAALAEAVAAAISQRTPPPPVAVVCLGEAGGDAEFADAFVEAASFAVHRVPATTSLYDLVAIIRGSAAFVGASLHGNILACAYGRPHVALDLTEQSELEGFARMVEDPACRITGAGDLPGALATVSAAVPRPDVLAALQGAVDQHFDALADLARRSAADRPDAAPVTDTGDLAGEVVALRGALLAKARRMNIERAAVADRMADVLYELHTTADALEEAVEARNKAEHALRTIMGTRAFRYLELPRKIYGRLRRLPG
jgi:polysaccharide pyruvyl transferase WcaK-like protein